VKVYYKIKEIETINNPVVTIGTFDGLHKGHVEILELLKRIARDINGETIIITFHPHPRKVLYPDDDTLKLLTTFQEKLQLFEDIGIENVLVLAFRQEISELEPEDFVKDILVNAIGSKHLVIGHDHRFGKNRKGDFNTMMHLSEEYDFVVEEIPPFLVQGITVSSTKIRNALTIDIDLQKANHLLGRKYSLNGKVVEGNKNGRKLGFPTCNLYIEDVNKLIPANGVYAAIASVSGNQLNAVVNIGNRPTFNLTGVVVEAHLLNFDADLYGEELKLEFIERLRDEQKFENLDALKIQIGKDIEVAEKIFANTI